MVQKCGLSAVWCLTQYLNNRRLTRLRPSATQLITSLLGSSNTAVLLISVALLRLKRPAASSPLRVVLWQLAASCQQQWCALSVQRRLLAGGPERRAQRVVAPERAAEARRAEAPAGGCESGEALQRG
eukprot:6015316-Pyramimonas_sp.AAC.1